MDEREIGKNLSSGAEKVENIERQAAAERAAAERRVEEAKRRLMEKQAEKNRQANASHGGEKADENAQNKEENKGQKKGQNNGNKKRGDGLGGWIAAVVSLGVVSLAMTAVVTVGAIKMRDERAGTAASYRGTIYEVIHVIEEVDDDFEAIQISEDPAKQAELLTNVLVQTRIAEVGLERLPFECQNCSKTMTFLNVISRHAERMLEKLSLGGRLTKEDKELLEEFYESEHKIRLALDELAATLEDDDVEGLLKGKECRITEAMQNLENYATPKMPHVKQGDKKSPEMPQPKASKMQDRAGIPSKKAEEYCKNYFADYAVTELNYAGETLGKGLKAYNFEMRTEKGVSIFAQISQADGALIYFDYYEECHAHTHDIETAKNMAVEFLQKLGYENMIPVGVDESGTNADFTFAYYEDGCTYYPDEIVVKVCEERGVVSGLDASKYLKNHRGRDEMNVELSMQEARDMLSERLTVEASRLVVFEHKGKEFSAYEFFCSYNGETYFVYLDTANGRELFIVNSKNM